MMTTTLSDMTKKKLEPSAEAAAAEELVRLAWEQGLSLTGPDGVAQPVHQERARCQAAATDPTGCHGAGPWVIPCSIRHPAPDGWCRRSDRWVAIVR
jgi:hypothetical protein